jgi:hypothetical protein
MPFQVTEQSLFFWEDLEWHLSHLVYDEYDSVELKMKYCP